MALKPIILLEPQTGAKTSEAFPVVGAEVPATLIATGLAGVETIAVEISLDGGTTWQPVIQESVTVVLVMAACVLRTVLT